MHLPGISKKIIHLSRLFSPHLGGVEVHVREVARIQVQRGWAVTVLTEQHQQGLPLEETSAGIKIIRIPQDSRREIAGLEVDVAAPRTVGEADDSCA